MSYLECHRILVISLCVPGDEKVDNCGPNLVSQECECWLVTEFATSLSCCTCLASPSHQQLFAGMAKNFWRKAQILSLWSSPQAHHPAFHPPFLTPDYSLPASLTTNPTLTLLSQWRPCHSSRKVKELGPLSGSFSLLHLPAPARVPSCRVFHFVYRRFSENALHTVPSTILPSGRTRGSR